MKNFFLGLAVGATITGTAAKALGITVDGISSRSLLATVLMAGTIADRAEAYRAAEKLLAGK